jgi:1-phosphofructokinase family hexose kinase
VPVLTVTLNAAVDKLYTIPGFAVDRVQRPTEMHVYAGGKGINVARAYRTLGGEVTATGFSGGATGEYIQTYLRREGIAAEFVTVTQESRTCTAILDPIGHTETVLNENGPQVSLAECDALVLRLRELLPGHDAVILSGSLPLGAPLDIYAIIIRLAQEELGVKAVLDASGEALQSGVEAKPFLVKPNVHELEALSIGGDGWGGSAQALRAKYGVTLALVTGGARGAVLASAEGTWEAVPPSVQVVSALGSGDSLTAGFVWAWEQGWGHAEALKLGVAAGAANATVYGSGFCTREQIFALASGTTVNQIG